MSTKKRIKINQLLNSQPSGVVFLSSWLTKQGYSLDLQQRYKKSDWLQSIGTGAMIRSGEKVGYEGAIYALQVQSDSNIHPGGKTALAMQGKTHYLEFSSQKVMIFGGKGEKLPMWFLKYDWGLKVDYHNSSFLPADVGLTSIEFKTFTIKISSAVRAVMECLYLTPKYQELFECYELIEGLNNLRPNLVQELLEQCTSVKVKRLFMYMSEKANHDWVNYINLEKIDFGKGKRSLVKNGVYIPKYRITIPKELEEHGRTTI
ncbi:MAG: type IV toxin-antitoxin system AbiEi family antitoxin [Aureibaculum sp.]|nr:type IV toxin-antitoxin system AbiEi family antitoxin [Aureibaculum sp.]